MVLYCKKLTPTIEHLNYGTYRASLYMLMKQCSFIGNIFVNNEWKFDGLNAHIYVNDRCFF